jgi:hypothetical protein
MTDKSQYLQKIKMLPEAFLLRTIENWVGLCQDLGTSRREGFEAK